MAAEGDAERSVRAALDMVAGDPVNTAARAQSAAVGASREAGSPYHLAQALLDLAESRRDIGDEAGDLVAEALAIGQVLRSPLVIRRAGG